MKEFLSKKGHIIIVIVLLLCVSVIGVMESYSNKNIDESEVFYASILKNNTVLSPDNVEDSSGLYYDNSDNSYYFKGNVENNYIVINSELWRIVSVNSDKSIKVIKESGINSNKLYKYNEEYNNYEYVDSNIMKELELWYKENLSNVDSYISDSEFCVFYQYEKCEETKKYKIGLLTFEDIITAGGAINTNNDAYYLYNGNDWWILDNDYDEVIGSAYSGYVNLLGSIDKGFIDEEKTIRPVINIKEGASALGDGTLENPYYIVNK